MFEHHFPIVNYDLRVVIRNARFASSVIYIYLVAITEPYNLARKIS